MRKLATALGYAVIAVAGVFTFLLFWQSILSAVLGIGITIVVIPLSIICGIVVAGILAMLITLPARPFMTSEAWEGLVGWVGVAIWIIGGAVLTLG